MRVAIGYAVVAWAIVEIADILLPTFDAPDWVFRAIVAVGFLGFPVTIILAWVFDISGKQLVVTEEEGISTPKWVKGVIAIPLIGLVGALGWWVWSGYVAERESSVRPTDLTDRVPIVAVMPIRNVTGNPDLDWYSDGLANLVRDNLTRSRFLRVVSPQKWRAIIGEATDEAEITERAADEGIGFVLGGEMLITPGGITVTSRLTDTEGGVSLSSRQVENLTPETLLTAAVPLATQVRQGLNVPREEQVDIFAADFATDNLAAYESYVAGLGFFLDYQFDRAEQSFNAALQLAPDFAIARYRLAYIQAVTGRTELAITNTEKALESTQLADRERQYIQAALALFKRDYADAAARYEALLDAYPFEIEAREMLAKAYWSLGRREDTIRIFEQLASEEPQNEVIWSSLGGYLLAMGQYERAQPALQRYAQLAPDNANSHALLGDSMRFRGQLDEAAEQYEKALAINPELPDVAVNLATIAYLRGNYDGAQAQFQVIAENEDLSIRERHVALFPMVSLLAARGDFASAIEWLDRFSGSLKEERIREAMAVSMKALFQAELGQDASARELATAAIGLSPGVPTRYLFARGLLELRAGNFSAVRATAQEIAGHALPPENPDRTEEKAAAFLSGMADLGEGKLDAAAQNLQTALDLGGYRYRIYELGKARQRILAGKPSDALAILDSATAPDPADARIDLEPDRVRALLLKAEAAMAEGDAAAAAHWARAFIGRFDRAEPSHPDMMKALDLAGEAGLALTASPKTKQGGHWAALQVTP